MIRALRFFFPQLDQQINQILAAEIALFSILFGIAFRSWLLSIVMILGLLFLLGRRMGPIYASAVLSLLWAFIALSIGYSLGGVWATSLAFGFLIFGILSHFVALKNFFQNLRQDKVLVSANWYLRQQNLN